MNGTVGTGATLNSGDILIGGTGIDTLVLTGSGSFDLNSLTTFTGFEALTLNGTGETITLPNSQAMTVHLGNGNTVAATYSEFEVSTFTGTAGAGTKCR